MSRYNRNNNRNAAKDGRRSGPRSGRGGRRPNPSKTSLPLGKIAVMAAAVIVPTIGGGLIVAEFIGDEKIQANFCFPRDDQHVHAVYLDASHTADMSGRQQRDYARVFENVYLEAPFNTRIDVFTSGRDQAGSIARPVASMCKPAQRPQDLEALDVRVQNQAFIDTVSEKARTTYAEIVSQVLTDSGNMQKTALDSAILSDLQSISRYPGFKGFNRSLTILSDGIENSETARFCAVKGDLPRFSNFEAQAKYRFVAPDGFDDATVNLMLVQTNSLPNEVLPYCTDGELRAFWTDYFNSNGAANVRLNYLRHGAE